MRIILYYGAVCKILGKPRKAAAGSLALDNCRDNLMMAAKHIGVTHIAASSTKFMGNGAQHGIACAVAVRKCIELDTSCGDLAAIDSRPQIDADLLRASGISGG